MAAWAARIRPASWTNTVGSHWRMRGVASDEGPCAILSAARNGFGLDVEYRPRGRTLRDIRIDHWRTRMRETMRGMRRIGLEEQ